MDDEGVRTTSSLQQQKCEKKCLELLRAAKVENMNQAVYSDLQSRGFLNQNGEVSAQYVSSRARWLCHIPFHSLTATLTAPSQPESLPLRSAF